VLVPLLTSKFDSICYLLRRRLGIGGLRGGPKRRCGVGGLRSYAVVSAVRSNLPSLFRPRNFRSEAAGHIDNRWVAIIRYG
jgi:hypothetical protein